MTNEPMSHQDAKERNRTLWKVRDLLSDFMPVMGRPQASRIFA